MPPAPRKPNPARPDEAVSPDDVAALPFGTLLWGDQAWVVVSGGLAPVSLLSNSPDEWQPDGEPARSLGESFTLISRGNGRLPTGRTAQRKVMDWWNKRQAARSGNPVKMAPVPTDPKLKKAYDLFVADFKSKSGGMLQNAHASYETERTYKNGEGREVLTGRIEGLVYYAGWSGEGQLYLNYVLEGGVVSLAKSAFVSWDKLPAKLMPTAMAMHHVAKQVGDEVLGEDSAEDLQTPAVGKAYSVNVSARRGADLELAWIMIFEPAVRAMRGGGRKALGK